MDAVFVDTWAWIALASADDQYHATATAQHRELKKTGRQYVTTDFVLSELVTHLYRKQNASQAGSFIQGLLNAFDISAYRLIHLSPHQFRKAWLMRKKYSDKPDISFVDFTSMVVMQDLGIMDVFTGDAHFEQVGWVFGSRHEGQGRRTSSCSQQCVCEELVVPAG